MPSRSNLPGSVNRNKFAKALSKLDFTISRKGGKGDHYKATFKNEKSITLPNCDLRNDQLCYLLKEIEKISGVKWDEIRKEL